jgi:hypothetical protein
LLLSNYPHISTVIWDPDQECTWGITHRLTSLNRTKVIVDKSGLAWGRRSVKFIPYSDDLEMWKLPSLPMDFGVNG